MSAILLCSFLLLLARQTVGDCVKINSCSCMFDDGRVIDLTPLAGSGSPTFFQLPGPEQFLYSYNPCNDFSDAAKDCINVAVCQISSDRSFYYDLGDQNSAIFSTVGDVVTITYSGTGELSPSTRTSEVKLICASGDDKLNVLGETSQSSRTYDFELSSLHCCPRAPGGGGSSSSISIGTILCIIVIVLVTVYFVGGILFLKFVKKEEGSDVIPNKNFWFVLPGLIKEGILFAVRPCRKTSAYENV
ncbi:uncharacterized protein LOC144434422 [Glandiceps talaboti]